MYNVKRTSLSRQFWFFTILHGGILLSGHSFGQIEAEISGLDDIAITAWAGATGDLIGSDTFCAVSCFGSCNRNNQRLSYRARAYVSSEPVAGGNFYISNGVDNLLVYLDWNHPAAGTTRMDPYSFTPLFPGAYSCTADTNSQNAINIILPAAQLASASAGIYSQTFVLGICSRIFIFDLCSAEVTFTVNLPELIQVTNLDDVNLGVWNGTTDLQVTEDFCVFRNGNGGVAIRTNGSNDTAGQFNLSGADTIPYTLEYSQGGGFFAAQPGMTINSMASGFTGESVRDCTNVGGTNTTVRISVNAADMGARSPGSYGDTVTIYVEPD